MFSCSAVFDQIQAPPASKEAVKSLPTVSINDKDVGECHRTTIGELRSNSYYFVS